MSILVAIPQLGNIRTELVKFLLRIDKRDDVEIHFSNAQPVDVNRNKIANYFLDETDHDWLIMIDADIHPPNNILNMIKEYPEKKIMSPVIFSLKGGIPYPVVSEFKDTKNGKRLRMSTGAQGAKAIKADGTGTGCIFIKREVFDKLEQPYFEFTKNEKGELKEGEDFIFCLKARDAGFKIWMIMDYVSGHFQTVDFKYLMKLLNLGINLKKENVYFEETGDSNVYEKDTVDG